MASVPATPKKKTKRVAVTSDFHKTTTYAARKGADIGTIVHRELELWCKYRIEPKTEQGKRGKDVLVKKGFEGRDAEIKVVSPVGAEYPRKGRIDLIGTKDHNQHFIVEIKTTQKPHSVASSQYKVDIVKPTLDQPLVHDKYFPCWERKLANTLYNEHRAQLLAYLQFYAHKKKMPEGVPLEGAVLYLTADHYLWEPVSQVYKPFTGANQLREDIKERKALQAIAREEKKAAQKKERERAKKQKCKDAAAGAAAASASRARSRDKESGTRKRKSAPKASPSSKRSRLSSSE